MIKVKKLQSSFLSEPCLNPSIIKFLKPVTEWHIHCKVRDPEEVSLLRWSELVVRTYNSLFTTHLRDADAQQGCRTYTLRRSVLLKLPKVNESTKGYFTVGRRVMAMYPRTTSFYPATVSAPAPRRDSNGLEMVEVQFDDDEDEYGELPKISIPAHFIGLPPSISS
eukprot:74657_1